MTIFNFAVDDIFGKVIFKATEVASHNIIYSPDEYESVVSVLIETFVIDEEPPVELIIGLAGSVLSTVIFDPATTD